MRRHAACGSAPASGATVRARGAAADPALAFAVLRETDLAAASFGPALRARAAEVTNVRIVDDRARIVPWAGSARTRCAAGDARAATERSRSGPSELLRRVDQVVRRWVGAAARLDRRHPRHDPARLPALAHRRPCSRSQPTSRRGARRGRGACSSPGRLSSAVEQRRDAPPPRCRKARSSRSSRPRAESSWHGRGASPVRARGPRSRPRRAARPDQRAHRVPCEGRVAGGSEIAIPEGGRSAAPALGGAARRARRPRPLGGAVRRAVALPGTCYYTNLVVAAGGGRARGGALRRSEVGPPALGASELVRMPHRAAADAGAARTC